MPNPIRVISEVTVDGNEYIVTAHQLVATDVVVIRCYERGSWSSHSSSFTLDSGETIYKVSSRSLPSDLDALPAMTRERIERVGEWRKALHGEAIRVIRATYPGLPSVEECDLAELLEVGADVEVLVSIFLASGCSTGEVSFQRG